MSLYKHILVAVDLSEDAQFVLEKAKVIADSNQAKITLVHVVEPLSVGYGSDIALDLTTMQDEITDQAKEQLQALSSRMSIENLQQYVVYGRPDREVHRLAEDACVDLIVVGSHGRHGLALIFGSTSTGILHGAKCDFLAIRVGK